MVKGHLYNSLEYLALLWYLFTIDGLPESNHFKAEYRPRKEFACLNYTYILVLWLIFQQVHLTFRDEMAQLGLFFTAEFQIHL